MSSYYFNEAVIDLPEPSKTRRPFVDKTIHGLEAKLPDKKTLGVLVHRRPLEAEKNLRALVDENIALNRKRLSAYTVLDDAAAVIGGVPGFVLRTRWRLEGTVYYQLQAHVIIGAQWMILAVSGPIEHESTCDQTFGTVVRTISWRSA